MKKFALTFVAMFMTVMAMAQQPSVTITYDSIGALSIETSYTKNDVCDSFYYFSGNIGEADMWAGMMGGLENVVRNWGIKSKVNVSKTWTDLTPNTDRVFYVLAEGVDTSILITDTVKTAKLGGTGVSTIEIAISEITDSSAHVVVTPNDQTSEFHTILVEKRLYNDWGQDSLVNYIMNDPYPQYVVDDHVWPNLVPGTDYKVVAVGINVNDEIGTVAVDSFSTTGVRPMPAVTITYDSIKTSKVTTSYVKNGSCQDYYIFMGMVGEIDQWLPMMGSVEAVIKGWGIHCTMDTTKNWTDMIPNTKYVFYTLAVDDTIEVVATDTITTAILGGEGLSTIEIAVSEITDSTARVICTPNDQTAEFHTVVMTAALYDEWGVDSVMNYVKQDLYAQYDVDDHVWFDLQAGTTYKALALGKNANGEWGELQAADFTTTGSNGIGDVEAAQISVYPNPTTDFVKVSNLQEGSVVMMYDLQGRAIMNVKSTGSEMTIDMNNLTAGMYILVVNNNEGIAPASARVIKK